MMQDVSEIDADKPSLLQIGQAKRNRTRFLGLNYDLVTEDAVLDYIRSYPPQRKFSYVVTPNSDHVVRLSESSGNIRDAYLDADICINDSRVIALVSKLFGYRLTTVTGADLVKNLFFSASFQADQPILLVGGSPALFGALVERFGLTNAKHYDAPMGLLTDKVKFDKTLAFVQQNAKGLTLFAVGSPQQELLAHAVWQSGRATGIGLCIGAAIEFLIRPEDRAPRWMSSYGLEWLFRLMKEPRRLWRRYLIQSPKVLGLIFKQWRAGEGPSA